MFWFFMYIACLCNHYFWTLLVGCISSKIKGWIHPWMQDIDEHLNEIQMDGCHSSILQMYLSIWYVYILWYKLCIVFTLKLMNVIQYMIYFICGISLFWPTIGGVVYESTFSTTIPFMVSLESTLHVGTWKKDDCLLNLECSSEG
jgi:hypothetical protein